MILHIHTTLRVFAELDMFLRAVAVWWELFLVKVLFVVFQRMLVEVAAVEVDDFRKLNNVLALGSSFSIHVSSRKH